MPEVVNLVSSSSDDGNDGNDADDPLPLPAPADGGNGNSASKRKRRGAGGEEHDGDDEEEEAAAARRRIMQHAAQRAAASASASASAGPANMLTAQLHRERMARMAAAGAGAAAGPAAAPRSSPPAPASRPPSFSLLTYNVWFEERRVPSQYRMRGVSDVISVECGCPDVVCLQEVTPGIRHYLRAYGGAGEGGWADRYDWSPVPSDCPYFTLLLVRRDSPLRGPTSGSGGGGGGGSSNGGAATPLFRWRPYRNSRMGRGLHSCAVAGGGGPSAGGGFFAPPPPLVVATAHLESPVSDEWGTETRRAQLQASIALLDGEDPGVLLLEGPAAEAGARPAAAAGASARALRASPNVILAGDLNWGEKDREMPLPGGSGAGGGGAAAWRDAWLASPLCERGGGGDGHAPAPAMPRGYTYDARTNGMLRGGLQLRLDRCLARLRDWRVAGAALVGTRGMTQPGAWPSDHYGLLVRFEGVEGAEAGGARGRRLGGGAGGAGGASGSGGGGRGGGGGGVSD